MEGSRGKGQVKVKAGNIVNSLSSNGIGTIRFSEDAQRTKNNNLTCIIYRMYSMHLQKTEKTKNTRKNPTGDKKSCEFIIGYIGSMEQRRYCHLNKSN